MDEAAHSSFWAIQVVGLKKCLPPPKAMLSRWRKEAVSRDLLALGAAPHVLAVGVGMALGPCSSVLWESPAQE